MDEYNDNNPFKTNPMKPVPKPKEEKVREYDTETDMKNITGNIHALKVSVC